MWIPVWLIIAAIVVFIIHNIDKEMDAAKSARHKSKRLSDEIRLAMLRNKTEGR